MADFPVALTNVIPGQTEIKAAHINNLEAKVGVDGSAVVTSLDYLLKNPASVNPGHLHTLEALPAITASAAELNLLDLSALTAGWVLRATGAAAAAWGPLQAADLPTGIDAAKMADGSVSNAEFQYLNGVTAPLQSQLDGMAMLAGRAGGQTLIGGTGAGENLTLSSTAHATKGAVLMAQGGGKIGIGTPAPDCPVHLAVTVDPVLATSSDWQTPTGIGDKVALTLSGSTAINSTTYYGAAQKIELNISQTADWSKLWFANVSRYSYKGSSGAIGALLDSMSVLKIDTTASMIGAYGIYNSVLQVNTGAITTLAGTFSRAQVSPATAISSAATNVFGTMSYAMIMATVAGSSASATALASLYGYASVTASASGTTAAAISAYGVWASIGCSASNGGTASITDAYGFYYKEQASTGTITNLYGVYIEEPTHGATLNYALYSAGGKNFFGGNILLGGASVLGTNAAKVLGIASGTAPATAPADAAQVWVEDINAAAGKAGLHMMAESGTGKLVVAGVLIKATAGDPSQVHEGLMCINTNDNNLKMYCEGAWRQLASWQG